MSEARDTWLIVWDVDGTVIPADLRWLRRSIARTYGLTEDAVVFPGTKVHGYTDESIVVDTAVTSGIDRTLALEGVPRFRREMAQAMERGQAELARVQPPYPGVSETMSAMRERGFMQTVLTGNLRTAADIKLRVAGVREFIDLDIGAFGSDAADRFALPEVLAERFSAKYGVALDPAKTVVIGDAPNDIACARHGGFRVIAVAHRASLEELARYSPDAVVDNVRPENVFPVLDDLMNAP
jgi:phosphoglycolate phosphatase-like HAD superfamily hydrolase